MVWRCTYAVAPDGVDHIRSYFVLACLLEVACSLGLAHTPSESHFIGLVDNTPNLGTPCLLESRSPAPKPPCWDAVREGNIPPRLVTVPWRALRAGAEAMNLAVEVDSVWRFQTSIAHGVLKLLLGWCQHGCGGWRP